MKGSYYPDLIKKFDQLQDIRINIYERHIGNKTATAIIANKSVWIQLIIICKIQARILDEMAKACRWQMKNIERVRKLSNDPYFIQDDYIALGSDLLMFEEEIKANSKRALCLAQIADDYGMGFEDSVITSALSINQADWNRFVNRKTHLMTMLISKVGDEPISWHVIDSIFDEIMSNPEGRRMLRKKTEEMFPGTFDVSDFE